jgi:two-component system, cell cycle sensor histidine kinase and response regulator CckA
MTSKPTYEELEQRIKELERSQSEINMADKNLLFTQFSVDRASDGVLWIREDAHIQYANETACRHLGYSKEELTGMTVFDIDPNFNAEVWPEHWRELKEKGRLLMESRHRWKTGEMLPVEISINYLEFEGEQYHVAFIHNMTERRRKEEKFMESEKKFTAAFEGSHDAITLTTKDGRVLDCNRRTLELFGLESKEEFLEKRPAEFSPPFQPSGRSSHEVSRELIHKVLHHGGALQFEWLHQRKTGEVFPAEILLTPIRIGDEEVLQATIRDISGRKRIEEALRQSEELYRTVVESTTDAIIVLDADRKMISCNAGFSKLFGYTVDEVNGQSVRMLHPSEEAFRLFGETAYRSIERTESYRGEVYFCKKSGVLFPAETVTSAIRKSGSMAGFVGIIRDMTERKRAEEALRESEAFIKSIMDNLPIGVAVNSVDPAVKFLYMNDNFPKFYRTTREALAKPDFFWDAAYEEPEFREKIKKRVLDDIASGNPGRMFWEDVPITRKGAATSFITAKNIPIPDRQLMVSTVWDVTERKRAYEEMSLLQEQLRQSQKVEAIGLLAGGIAHDFNNALTVILANSEMMLRDVGRKSTLFELAGEIKKAGERASKLTKQLLAFSRKQILQPEILNLNEVVLRMRNLLRRVIGENIELETVLLPDLGLTEADPGQIEQVIVNLAVNARDAMPTGGKLTVETRSVELNEQYARTHLGVTPGFYVMLAVTDTGVGMTKEIQARIFEPFFTTKEKGKGTGLGLATVYGIVKQSRGSIWVYSEPSRGTSFKIYLPRVEAAAPARKDASGEIEIPHGSETVLVVEDEEMVRNVVSKFLNKYGYTVLSAADGHGALLVCSEHKGSIHLMLTDVVMPGLSGKELAEQAKELRPDLKVLFMSGHTDGAIVNLGILEKGIAFIQKPFTHQGLAWKVRAALDG